MSKGIKIWLILCAIMVLVMIFIGGLTRLSDAGLSIVEWRPVSGIFPPASDAEWSAEFMKYQTSPEFKLINNQITIEQFKYIFWLEFGHRLVARITGLMIFIPLIYFYFLGYISIKRDKKYLLLPTLFMMQGVMGWLMVKSGLIDNPHVSHFRLAAHLLLAVLLYHVIISCLHGGWKRSNLAYFVIGLTYLQIIFGAFVAGLDAGMIYNSFPLMGNLFVPIEVHTQESVIGALSDEATVQFLHRIIAYVLTIFVIIRVVVVAKENNIGAFIIFLSLITQLLLGVITLIYVVPIGFALLHQLGAMILLASLIIFDIDRSGVGSFKIGGEK
ncbi:MAG: COX15/CtaA family protein [Rickettsiaceae bacterium]|nr:COX15/CtaA family protein [Rickettsiaceae bacterium]